MEKRTVPLEVLTSERKIYKEKIKNMEGKMEELLKNQITENENVITEENIALQDKPDYLSEFAQLMQNPTYSDSNEHLDEIREYAEMNGVTLKTAYNALFAEEKYEKIRQKAEQDAYARLNLKQSRKVEAVDGGSGIGKKVAKLNSTQLEVASACGMTPEEYAKYM